MLNQQPPGFNSQAVNAQDNQILPQPGRQGGPAQGYYDPYSSSYALPSNYASPSSINVPNPWYAQHQQSPIQSMVQALRGNG